MFILGGTCRLVTEIESGDRSVKRIRVAPQHNQGHEIPQTSLGQQGFNQSRVARPQGDGGHNTNLRQRETDDFEDGGRTRVKRKNWAKISTRQSSILSLVESNN